MSTDTTAGPAPEPDLKPEEEAVPDSEAESAAWAHASEQVDAQTTDSTDPTDVPQAQPAQSTDDNPDATPEDTGGAATGATEEAEETEPTPLPPTGTPVDADDEPSPGEEEPTVPLWDQTSRQSRSEEDILLDGSSVVGHPKPRTAAHWAGVLVWVVALPLTWFLLHDGAAAAVDGTAPLTFGTTAGALVRLGAGAVVLALALWTASYSSLGAFVVGTVSLLIGLPFVAAPAAMNSVIGPLLDRLTTHSDLGASLSGYFWADAVGGKFIAFGLFMIMVGFVSHNARRAGRREKEIIDRAHRIG